MFYCPLNFFQKRLDICTGIMYYLCTGRKER
nr:MAG TPA: hypothetical protein [Bacteriophage sp.]